jgi:glc operon protein GlcG
MRLRSTPSKRAWVGVPPIALLTVVCLGMQSASLAQEREARGLIDPVEAQRRKLAPPELTVVPSEVRDSVRMFSIDAVRGARESLEQIEKSTGVPVLIETIDSLQGETVDEVATRLARRSGTQGVFILVARKESKIEVLASRRYSDALPRPARANVRAAFVDSFRKEDFDGGLSKGIKAIREELSFAKQEGRLPKAEQPPVREDTQARAMLPQSPTASQSKSLVVRNQVRLTLEGARSIIAAAEHQASAMNLKVNVAVVDDGGHLLSFDRMNGARPASGYTAITKAATAATFRQPTGPLPAGTTNPDPLLNLSLQIAAGASGGKITTLYGGVPVVVDGQVIGGVGVGGGTGEQDAEIARAGIQALLDELKNAQ